MSNVLVTCCHKDCKADSDLTIGDVYITITPGCAADTYTFKCPNCRRRVTRETAPRTVKLLLAAGAPTSERLTQQLRDELEDVYALAAWLAEAQP